ncbi:MAG: phosphatase [Bacteroidaceae bacterium]|nr:phosphatase [Bacteroidaceae bacterium]
MVNIKLDVHTHTIVSGHAFSTLNEMIQEGQKRGLTLLGVTEHGPALPGACHEVYFRNLHVVPRVYGNMRLLLGAELNIIDYEGNVDITTPNTLDCMELIIAGLHQLCYTDGNREQNTSALLGAIENPRIHIISHPCDGTASDFDIEAVVLAAKRTNTLLELNSSSLNPTRHKQLAHPMFVQMLNLCKQHEVPIILGSDAHHTSSIGDYRYALPLLEETSFPDALIINDKPQTFLQIIGK